MKILAAFLLAFLVGVVLGQWDPIMRIDSLSGDVWGNGIAFSGTTVHVAYGVNEIYYRRSTDEGTTWSDQVRLASSGFMHLTDPMVADGDNVYIFYLKDQTSLVDFCCTRDPGNIYVLASSDGGATWKPEVRATNYYNAFRYSATVANGVIHLVFMTVNATIGGSTVYTRSTDMGATWSTPVILAVGKTTFGAARPQVAALGNNVHVTVWGDEDGGSPCTETYRPNGVTNTINFSSCPDVFYIGSTDGGLTWPSTMTRVANSGAGFAGRNDVAAPSDGSVIINYNRFWNGTTGQKMFVRRSTNGGASWSSETQFTFDAESDHGSIHARGLNVHLAWHDSREASNSGLEIYQVHSYDGGVTWQPEERASTGISGDSSTPLNVVGVKYFHLIWLDNNGGNGYKVVYRRRLISSSSPTTSTADSPSYSPSSPIDAIPSSIPASNMVPSPVLSNPPSSDPSALPSPSPQYSSPLPQPSSPQALSQTPSPETTSGPIQPNPPSNPPPSGPVNQVNNDATRLCALLAVAMSLISLFKSIVE